jgi:hypothetical protein
MASRYKDKDAGGVVLSFNGQWVSWAHPVLAYGTPHPGGPSEREAQIDVYSMVLADRSSLLSLAAFVSAFVVGVSLHYHKIVQNEWFGYPEEWFPSVSATIGDRYPERSFFMVFIAMTSGTALELPSSLNSRRHTLTLESDRSAIRPRRPVVPPYCEARPQPAQVRRLLGRL